MMVLHPSPPRVLTSEGINVKPTEHHFPSLPFLWCVTIILLSMNHCIKKKSYFAPFSARSVPGGNERGHAKVIASVWDKLIPRYIAWSRFLSRPVNEQMFVGISSPWERGRKEKINLPHFQKTSSAAGRVGGCSHWITTFCCCIQ